MSGTRFARSGRCRFFICFGTLVLLFGMVAIFHSSQQQLEETREQRLRCEQQQGTLNERLQLIVEQKFNLEKNHDQERTEQMEQRRNLELKLKELNEMQSKEQLETRQLYETLQHAHKLLQIEHNALVNETAKGRIEQLQSTNSLDKQLQLARVELEKQKGVQQSELAMWRDKYNVILKETLNSTDIKKQLQKRITNLEQTVNEYKMHCDYKPHFEQQQINKPLNLVHTTHAGFSLKTKSLDTEKSFNAQDSVSAGSYRIGFKITNKLTDTQSDMPNFHSNNLKNVAELSAGNNNSFGVGAPPTDFNLKKKKNSLTLSSNRSLILHSVENFQMLPKPVDENQDRGKHFVVPPLAAAVIGSNKMVPTLSELSNPTSMLINASTASIVPAVSGSLPLRIPSNQRKLPEYVAPIPDNFEDLLRSSLPSQKTVQNKIGTNRAGQPVVEMQKNENEHGNNNRYSNVVNDMESKTQLAAGALAVNEDSGAHEIKDRDFMNEQNFKLPNDAGEQQKDDDNADEDILGAGGAADIAVRNNDHLLDAESLNNEIAGDQGKEFHEGLHLEDINEEDEDEDDDYSNLAARQQGAQAIRH